MIELFVEGIAFDKYKKTVVLLRDGMRRFYVPIWIGPAEAMAIQMELEGKQPPRPMSHDLIRNILADLNAELANVVINDYRQDESLGTGIYYASIIINYRNLRHEIDARPSDAIALALRLKAAILVEDRVVEEAAIPMHKTHQSPPSRPPSQEDIDRFINLLDGVDLSGQSINDE